MFCVIACAVSWTPGELGAETRLPAERGGMMISPKPIAWAWLPMNRRQFVKASLAGAAALVAPQIVRAEARTTINFVPHADLASLDPVWTTADITRNFSLAVYDTLYGFDAEFNVQPQMIAGEAASPDGKEWTLTLRDGLKFHDGAPVLARDCVATIKRWGQRDPMGTALLARADEVSAASDK